MVSSGTFLAIVNPAAGGGRCGRRAPAALEGLRRAGLEIDERRTSGPSDATRLAREAYAEGYRNFIACGGDGTGFEVLNGMFPLARANGEQARLGFLPLGTGNAFLREFGPEAQSHAAESLREGRCRRCDVLVLHHDDGELYCINLLGFGFPVDVTVRTAGGLKRFGPLGYILGVLLTLARIRLHRLSYRLDEGPLEDDPFVQLCISNSRYTANEMLMAPGADIQDGRADLVQVAPMGRLELLRAFPTIFRGTHVELEKVNARQARQIRFEGETRVHTMIDGEIVEIVPRRLEVLQQSLEIIA